MKPFAGEHYLHKDKVYRVETVSRGTDEIVLSSVIDGTKFTVIYSVFKYGFERVWKIGDVARLLGRTPRSIYRYESRGVIRKPKRYQAKGRYPVRFYRKADIVEMRDMVADLHQGRPRHDDRVVNNSLISKSSLLSELKERYGV